MASLSKLSNSLVSMSNENTLALVNVNIDFALVRCTPSPEYSPVGTALTVKRKYEAENGVLHTIACKLGFLFHAMLPHTPKLHQAYGTRISQILSHPGVNPEGTMEHGPFRDFIGADCTSIWAAATSGPASISMLFLACMLSRAWDAKTAISIWVELIEDRKKQIWTQAENNDIVHPHSLAAAKQDISRSDLASWDASARSWLRRADVAMERQVTQLRLVERNITIPYWSGGSTSERVTSNWLRSMEMLEKLLSNTPQEASTRAVLLAMSAWHLYPDMLVFQKEATKISFADELFPNASILSVGLEYKGPADNVTQWSLSLSHFRYYGDPVRVRSDGNQGRLPPRKLWVIALGVIFRQWNVSYSKFDDAVAWFRALGSSLERSDKAHCAELSWLIQLCAAASEVQKPGQLEDGGLIKYGWRRAKSFLCRDEKAMGCAFFGLCNPYTMASFSKATGIEANIAYLRSIASQLQLKANEAIIVYKNDLNHECVYSEWATIASIEARLGLRNTAGSPSNSENRPTRWLHPVREESSQFKPTVLERRAREIEHKGEYCHIVYDQNELMQKIPRKVHQLHWAQPPLLFGDSGPLHIICLTSFQNENFQLWVELGRFSYLGSAHFTNHVSALEREVVLEEGLPWLEQKAQPQSVAEHLLQSFGNITISNRTGAKRKAPMERAVPPRHKIRVLNDNLPPESISIEEFEGGNAGRFHLMSRICKPSMDWLVSLRILELVNLIYAEFQSATVSLRIIDQNLLGAAWLPKAFSTDLRHNYTAATPATAYVADMSLAASFACIAMFESGHLNVDPDQMNQVLALCSEDSIFVAGIMLSDPSSNAHSTIRHLVGNVGHSGMMLMVSPVEPRIRAVGDDPQQVTHRPFDNKIKDSFGGTSLHLSFTTWKMPLDWEDTGAIDQGFFLSEAVVSVQDNGKWVADIDVLGMIKSCPEVIETFFCDDDCAVAAAREAEDIVSIDSWEEFLDPPPCPAVFRAKTNWAARLAAACILVQQCKPHAAVIVGDAGFCLPCLRDLYSDPEPHLPHLILN